MRLIFVSSCIRCPWLQDCVIAVDLPPVAWLRSGSRPPRPYVTLRCVNGGLGPSLILPRSHSGLRPPRFLFFFLLLWSQPDSASDGARNASWGSSHLQGRYAMPRQRCLSSSSN
jgi:hypothetical protein